MAADAQTGMGSETRIFKLKPLRDIIVTDWPCFISQNIFPSRNTDHERGIQVWTITA